MAVRIQVREEPENRARPHVGKNFYHDVRPRAPLGRISTNHLIQREQAQKSKLTGKPKKDDFAKVTLSGPLSKPKEKEVEEMEVAQMATKLAQQLSIPVDDIDTADSDNPQLCAEYVKDIYQYMRDLERKYHIPPTYMAQQPQINSRMRAILIDWLIQVHLRFTLLQETLYLTVSIIDRYLSACTVDKSKLQLVGVTAMLIASKYEEMYAPEVGDFVFITDNTYTSEQIRAMERHVLKTLDYSLGTPLCLHFLRRYSRAGEATPEMHTMGKFLLELCLPDYTMLEFHSSLLAAAALYIAMQVYHTGDWTPTLHHYTTYSKEDMMPCVSKLALLVSRMDVCKQQAVRTKYSSSKFMKIAKTGELRGEVIRSLATSQ